MYSPPVTTSAEATYVEPATSPRLAGLIPSGMLDWPGRVAATVFVAGCTMRCPYCHNPEVLSARKTSGLSLRHVLTHLEERQKWLDGVVVTGGEPTADPALVPLLQSFRDVGMPVKLDTNGTNPEVLDAVLGQGLVDYVAIDVKAVASKYDGLTGFAGAWHRVRQSIATLVASGVDHEFRTTCYPAGLTLDDLDEIAASLVGGRRLVLQQFRPTRTLDPGASSVRPYPAEALRHAALRCSVHLPTLVRGV